MTQEHLRNLIERAVDKVDADNNEADFIRTRVKFEPNQSENAIKGVIAVYEQPHRFHLSQTMNVMTGTTEYRFESELDNNAYNIPRHTDSSLTNAKIEDQFVNKVFELIDEKRLNIEEAPPTETQELIAYQMYDIWREVKEQNGYPDWALKCHPSGDPNKMYFQMNALGQQSIIAVGRYATHEEYPEGCLTIQTTRQPFKSHSAKSESDLCGVVMDHILYELHMINEDMLSDVSPNRKEYNI